LEINLLKNLISNTPNLLICWQCMEEENAEKFATIHVIMLELIELRRRLLSATLTQEQMTELKSKVASRIDYGNKCASFRFYF